MPAKPRSTAYATNASHGSPAAKDEDGEAALTGEGERSAEVVHRLRAYEIARRPADPDRGQRAEGDVLLEVHQTPGIAFLSGLSSTKSTTDMKSAIDARMMKNCAWLQRSQ